MKYGIISLAGQRLSATAPAAVSQQDNSWADPLILRAIRNDPGALAELYRLHAARVFALAFWLLGARDAAEDALGDIFMRLPAALTSYDGRVPFENWLLRITTNSCIDRLRRRTRERRLFYPVEGSDCADSADSPLEEMLLREREEAVRAAVRQLPPRYRVPLVLRYYCDLTYDEIAERIGLDRPQTGVLLFRAKRELHRLLGEASL